MTIRWQQLFPWEQQWTMLPEEVEWRTTDRKGQCRYMVTKWCLIRITLAFAYSCCSTIDSHWHSLLMYKPHKWLPWCCKKIVRAVDKYPIHNGGAHKKYIHMKCGWCKTLFIGCEVIEKLILKCDQWLNQKKGADELVEVNKKWNNYRWGRIKVHSKHWGRKTYLFY